MIRLLVGLGNPGAKYENTRHNAGFWWLYSLNRKYNISLKLHKTYQGLMSHAILHSHNVLLLAPQTFMNLSGSSVVSIARFYKIAPQEILVAHDELDLPAGKIKLKSGGGHAGHNGLRNINEQLGCNEYWRLRIGIGRPQEQKQVLSWVLGQPPAQERENIDEAIQRAVKAIPQIINNNTQQAMQLLNNPQTKRQHNQD